MPGVKPLILPLPPTVNMYWRHVGRRILLSREGRAYKRQVHAELLVQRAPSFPTGPVKLTATVYRPRRQGDLDNFAKALCDALAGLVYADDSQIVESHWYLLLDRQNPRVEVTVEANHASD